MQVTALVAADRVLRAHYVYLNEDGELVHRKDELIGWAAVDDGVYGVRVEPLTGRGLLVGSDLDPDREHLMAVLTAGGDSADVPGADERIRKIVSDQWEVDDAQEG